MELTDQLLWCDDDNVRSFYFSEIEIVTNDPRIPCFEVDPNTAPVAGSLENKSSFFRISCKLFNINYIFIFISTSPLF